MTTPEKFDERAGDTSDDALQNPPRRRFLRGAAAVIPIASVGAGAAGGLAAARSTHAAEVAQGAVTTPEVTYKPVYFQPTEWDFLHAAMDRLIPRDHLGPGAVDAGVPEFLDRQMQLPYGLGHLWYMDGPFVTDAPPELGYQLKLAPRDIYRTGIAAVNAYCIRTLGHAFSELDEPSRDKVLLGLEKGTITLGDAVPPKIFFSLLLDNTREGFLSDPMYGGNKNMIGWKFAGFPGARADFLDWVDHPNEPYPLGPVSILEKRG